ncbi:MAG: tetratricopeptide repeat protein, partial [Deltaproteobacteria bacterium]|nr:tetratricopeptide repeat protein [Deltaproteobacteria bacterium]
ALREQNDPDAGMKHFTRALTIDSEHVGALNNRGLVLMSRGQLDAARQHFARALEISPGYQDTRLNLERVNRLIKEGTNAQNK